MSSGAIQDAIVSSPHIQLKTQLLLSKRRGDIDELLALNFSLQAFVRKGPEHIFRMRDGLRRRVESGKPLPHIPFPKNGDFLVLPREFYPDIIPTQEDSLSQFLWGLGFVLRGRIVNQVRKEDEMKEVYDTYDVNDYVFTLTDDLLDEDGDLIYEPEKPHNFCLLHLKTNKADKYTTNKILKDVECLFVSDMASEDVDDIEYHHPNAHYIVYAFLEAGEQVMVSRNGLTVGFVSAPGVAQHIGVKGTFKRVLVSSPDVVVFVETSHYHFNNDVEELRRKENCIFSRQDVEVDLRYSTLETRKIFFEGVMESYQDIQNQLDYIIGVMDEIAIHDFEAIFPDYDEITEEEIVQRLRYRKIFWEEKYNKFVNKYFPEFV